MRKMHMLIAPLNVVWTGVKTIRKVNKGKQAQLSELLWASH